VSGSETGSQTAIGPPVQELADCGGLGLARTPKGACRLRDRAHTFRDMALRTGVDDDVRGSTIPSCSPRPDGGGSACGALAPRFRKAGGLGLIGAVAVGDGGGGGGGGGCEWLESRMSTARAATSKPWGIGFLTWAIGPRADRSGDRKVRAISAVVQLPHAVHGNASALRVILPLMVAGHHD